MNAVIEKWGLKLDVTYTESQEDRGIKECGRYISPPADAEVDVEAVQIYGVKDSCINGILSDDQYDEIAEEIKRR